jgi:ribonucleoside-triphosphate reductase|nr:MAG TPA: anaerobic ribonucleoside triphosphate reductase [Caudoviricetes sp.]
MKVIKRNGTEVEFDATKIAGAITRAGKDRIPFDNIAKITDSVGDQCALLGRAPHVEEIQDMVEDALMENGYATVARDYIRYRYDREKIRKGNSTDAEILSLIDQANEEALQENSNKDPVINSVQRDYMAGYVSKDLTERYFLPQDIVEADRQGIIHVHDKDYFAQHMHNCCLVNLKDMLQNGTVISGVKIDKPHSFSTACNIAMQIVAQVASSQYGGQTISLAHLAPFVDVSRQAIRKEVMQEMLDYDIPGGELYIDNIVERRLRKEIQKGIQTIQYQVITLMTTNGQAPFLSVMMYLNEAENPREKEDLAMLIEEMLNQRIQGVKNESGVWITPAFPKLLYVTEEDNIHEDSPYFYLTKLAAKCTAKRMVPDYISEKLMLELKGDCYPCMGCRSFLTPYKDENGKPKYYGRFNQGVVTINLPDVALTAIKEERDFFTVLDERLELCHRALRCRHERLKGTVSDVAPILWQHGALARLKHGETIDKLLYNGYSTISLGYAGLYECCQAFMHVSHTEPRGESFAIAVMRRLNDKCKEWREAEHIDYSVYGTPLESTTYKFAKCLRKRFGIIKEVTDHTYITNSYHVNVREPIDAFTKLDFESRFQKMSPGGAISYVEVPNLIGNVQAVIRLIQYMYDHIMYAEINTKSDYCQKCGYDGEIQIVEEDGKLIWECPKCGNRDQKTMNVARRTCGYIGTQFWNQGRTAEIRDRVMHL